MLGPRSTSFLAVLVCWSWTECSQQQLDSLPSSLAQAFMLLVADPNVSSSAIRKSNFLLWQWNVCIVIWQQWPASTNDKVSWVKAAFLVCVHKYGPMSKGLWEQAQPLLFTHSHSLIVLTFETLPVVCELLSWSLQFSSHHHVFWKYLDKTVDMGKIRLLPHWIFTLKHILLQLEHLAVFTKTWNEWWRP